MIVNSLCFGTRGRTRTGTLLRAGDFESPVSTNFTTLAQERDYSSGLYIIKCVCSSIVESFSSDNTGYGALFLLPLRIFYTTACDL